MRRPFMGACLFFVLLVLSFYICVPPSMPDYSRLDEQKVCITGEVSQIETKEYFDTTNIIYTLKDVRVSESMADGTEACYEHDQIYCYTSEKFERTYIGSKIAVKGDFSSFTGAENPGSFDSKLYYHILGVGACLKNTQLISSDGTISCVRDALHQLRFFFIQKTNHLFSEPYSGIIQAVLLGYKGDLDENIKQLYKEGGMLHIMTISGMHISMLGMGCIWLLKKARVPAKVSAVLGSFAVVLYGVMIGMQVATFRAVFMFCMRMLAKLLGRTYDAKTALGLSAVVLLLMRPMYLFHSGFLLSFGSVMGMVVVTPVLTKLWNCKHKFVQAIVTRFIASVGILVATLPIQLYFFYEYSLYSILVNFVVLPLLPYVVGIAVVVLALPGTWHFVTGGLVWVDEGLLGFYEWVCRAFGELPAHTIVAGAPKLWQIIAYYVILAVCLFWMDFGAQKEVPRKKRSVLLVPVLLSVVLILFVRAPEGFQCHFLSVGQGDCVVIREGDNTYLVDCGSSSKKDVAEDILLPFLKYFGISKVDGVFLSHADEDHINGITQWLDNYEHSHIKTNSIILPSLEGDVLQNEFGKVLSLCEVQGIPVSNVKKGDAISLGELQINVLSPSSNELSVKGNKIDSNEWSQVLLLEYETNRILLTGDIGTKTESELSNSLLGKPITVLKVAHHGSKHSSSEAFLDVVKPSVSILSYGENNFYGHPHKEVLDRLSRAESLILETPKAGCISIYFKSGEPRIKLFK